MGERMAENLERMDSGLWMPEREPEPEYPCETFRERADRLDFTCEDMHNEHRCVLQPQGYAHMKPDRHSETGFVVQHFCGCNVRWEYPTRWSDDPADAVGPDGLPLEGEE